MSVLHFFSSVRYRKPIVCIPALISRSYILDLSPGLSLIESLCAAGHDVYLIDWGIMSDEDAGLSLEAVVCEYIAKALDRVAAFSRAPAHDVIGLLHGRNARADGERGAQVDRGR